MFDIGFAELIIIGLVGLVVIGPERLPEAIRTAAKFFGKAKRTYANLRRDLEREIGADEIRRELYNEALLEELRQTRDQLNDSINLDAKPETSSEMTPLDTSSGETAQPAKSASGQQPEADTATTKPASQESSSTDGKPS